MFLGTPALRDRPREVLIEHLLQHYVERDRLRVALHEYQSRSRRSPHRQYRGISHVTHLRRRHPEDETVPGIDDWTLDLIALGKLQDQLTRCKWRTVEHLHELMHKEEYLNEYVHAGDEIFSFIIHEEPMFRLPSLEPLKDPRAR